MTTKYKEKWEKLLTLKRWNQTPCSFADPSRSPFAEDHDRILFSTSFRRLSHKTQVHPLSRNDHVHNRLSHSLEVSCVGRSLGTSMGLFLQKRGELPQNITPQHIGELVQAACLAHDIGNPPFGHAGEAALREWFRAEQNKEYLNIEGLSEQQKQDFLEFDGNAQGFRVVNSLEHQGDGGFYLSYPTLATMIKYPFNSQEAAHRNKPKFNFYQSEEKYFLDIVETLDLASNGNPLRHPLAYLVEAADDICYRIVDMEDALELNIISLHDIHSVCEPVYDNIEINEAILNKLSSKRRKAGYIRACLINYLVKATVNAFPSSYDCIMEGQDENILSLCGEKIVQYFKNAETLFTEKIMREQTKLALEIGSHTIYKCLLDAFMPAAYKQISCPEELTTRENNALTLIESDGWKGMQDHYLAYRKVIDFLTGMTDDYATFLANQFSGNII